MPARLGPNGYTQFDQGGRDEGGQGKPVDGELLQFLSPLGWEHINLTGDYVWRQSRRLEDGKFRPLRMPGKP